jgi:hypothetical protein
MEIDITRFVQDAEPFDFSGSVAERGPNAGRVTWDNAKRVGAETPLLTTPEQLDALRDHTRGFGAWEDEEIDGWSTVECNALFIQLVSGDLREIEALASHDDGEIDWDRYQELADAGTIGGSLYRGDDGRIFYYLGD